jgi:hypothetical protein
VKITEEMLKEVARVFCERYYGTPYSMAEAIKYALDALAAMPEPGCEGCKYESMEVFGCRDCTRRMRDHYTPKEAKE